MEREFDTDLSSIPDLMNFVEHYLEIAGLSEASFEIQLAVEEWFVNIVKHGFGGEKGGNVKVRLDHDDGVQTGGRLEVEISDDGPEFDPHSLPPAERPDSVEEAKIGGLGVHFIRNLMDETGYRRENGRNIFSMKKNLDADGQEGQGKDRTTA